jgi:SHS2 domain-containing protein
MAKQSASNPAMEFEFRAEDLERLLSSKPKKVLFTVWVEVVTTAKGEKVGALRIKAGTEKTRTKSRSAKGGGDVYGEPKPPGFSN